MINASSTSRVWLSLAVGLVLVGAVLNVFFLFNQCPFQLSQDEAHYWQWSRNLDYGYYSKPPGIAWLMAGTMRVAGIFGVDPDASGQTLMPILRLPAVLFGTLSGLFSIALARRIFRDDRTAFAVICLSAAVPMFAIGSMLITIDSPMYLCWAVSVYCLWRHVEGFSIFDFRFSSSGPESKIENRKSKIVWLYLAAVACAVGMLFKPVLIAIPLCVIVGCWLDPQIRRAFKSWHSVGGGLIVLTSQVPVVLWNAQHNWVTFRHIGATGGVSDDKATNYLAPLERLGQYVGGQAGGMGGLIFILLVTAIVVALQLRKNSASPLAEQYAGLRHASPPPLPAKYVGLNFLLAFTLPLWLFYLALSLWKSTQPNWPAASYFTGMVLLAGVFTAGWNSAVEAVRRRWRRWGIASIVWGMMLVTIVTNIHRIILRLPAVAQEKIVPTLSKLAGMEEQAAEFQASRERLAAETGMEPLLMANSYRLASSMTFYLPDHTFVYCLMSSIGGRHNQFDLWPGPNQKDADDELAFAGRPALILGVNPKNPAVETVLRPAFERLEGPEEITPTMLGVPGRKVSIYRGYGFKGFPENPSKTY
ncbi:MAG: glycosyltransferase family 39 protein [Phycisphaerales bacterium]|nr:glycosyltransferase family 39 protein [Phycisphaerales bacterium]